MLGFKQTFVSPIENPDVEGVIETKYRRLDRCFLKNTKDDNPAEFKKARHTLMETAKFVLQELPYLSDDYNEKVVDMLKCFLGDCIPSC